MDGFATPSDVDYRAHRPKWRDITVAGSEPTNAKSGIILSESNAGISKVGLADFRSVYIEGFTYAVNGQGSADSAHVYDAHLSNVVYGLYNFDTELRVTDTDFWNFQTKSGETPTAIKIVGDRGVAKGCEYEIGVTGGTTVDVDAND